MEASEETLEATRAALARREAAVVGLEETRRAQEHGLAELGRVKEQLAHERRRYSLLEGQLQVRACGRFNRFRFKFLVLD